jgi:hypothetical protein
MGGTGSVVARCGIAMREYYKGLGSGSEEDYRSD